MDSFNRLTPDTRRQRLTSLLPPRAYTLRTTLVFARLERLFPANGHTPLGSLTKGGGVTCCGDTRSGYRILCTCLMWTNRTRYPCSHRRQLSTQRMGEAFSTATYVRNGTPTKVLDGRTPYEVVCDVKPDLANLRASSARRVPSSDRGVEEAG